MRTIEILSFKRRIFEPPNDVDPFLLRTFCKADNGPALGVVVRRLMVISLAITLGWNVTIIGSVGVWHEIESFVSDLAQGVPWKISIDRTALIELGPSELDPENFFHSKFTDIFAQIASV
jgi:hypothetical protein